MKKDYISIGVFLLVFVGHSQQSLNKDNVKIGFVSDNIRFAKEDKISYPLNDIWETTAWKGEKVHSQILVLSDKDISNLTITVSDLINEKGDIISKNNSQIGVVGFVVTDEFGSGCGNRKPEDYKSSLVTDPIEFAETIDVKKGEIQPVWISIKLPQSISAGRYSGEVIVNAVQKYSLRVFVNVLDRVLPPPSNWNFDLDLWQHPAAIARVHNMEIWSAEHFEKMKPYYEMLANAGQKCITASIINEPWGHQTHDDFPSLIKWINKMDGSWVYDYSLFDKYIEFVMSCGINKRINCYTMVPWKLSFQYYDEKQNKNLEMTAKIGTKEYNLHWLSMLTNFTKHLKQKGWFDITSIAMDERDMKDMLVIIEMLKGVDSKWKISLAGNYHSEIEKDIFDYCVASKYVFEEQVLARRKNENKKSTWYTCCTEKHPNGFTFSPPAEHVWIGWYTASKKFTGYLRWAYNSWTQNPISDSRFTAWPAGDTYQVYPGPKTSIRFEKLIEGIQDFEKINILRNEFVKSGNQIKLKELNEVLISFDLDKLKDISAEKMIIDAKNKLNKF